MAKKWLDSIEKQKRSNVCDRQTDGHTHRQTASTTKNNKTPRLGTEINRSYEPLHSIFVVVVNKYLEKLQLGLSSLFKRETFGAFITTDHRCPTHT